ncbi:putative Transcriptional adapter ADA2 [Blattamonas nauphoetae]|uniref:Transcriptional adapter ADA2 n=1 Tax=Blattamonas nauphoetae TaxID=2049346 RepID=A0ABQ9XRV6_9EUKA|nr:putative Transcriptional adapter ADA2 [Blattamonas nauphoetae]
MEGDSKRRGKRPPPAKPNDDQGDRRDARVTCDYCGRDLTNSPRIVCKECKEFELCIDCFLVGACLEPHKLSHKYRIVQHLDVPLLDPDWTVEEELILLDSIESSGVDNWTAIQALVCSKSVDQCRDHYHRFYTSNPECLPVNFLSDEQILECKRKSKLQIEDVVEVVPEPLSVPLPTSPTESTPVPPSSSPVGRSARIAQMASKDPKNSSTKKQTTPASSTSRPKGRPSSSPSTTTAAPGDSFKTSDVGYREKRGEFDVEWDQEAEKYVSDMMILPSDTPAAIYNKLNVLHAYNRVIDERMRRKRFLVRRGLLNYFQIAIQEGRMNQFEKLTVNRLKPFMQYLPQDQYEALVEGVKNEARLRDQIAFWQRQKLNGLQTIEEVALFGVALMREEEKSATQPLAPNQPTGFSQEPRLPMTTTSMNRPNLPLMAGGLWDQQFRQQTIHHPLADNHY